MEDYKLTKWETMSQRMIDLENTINRVGSPDGEADPGITSITEDKGTANRNKRKAIAHVNNRNATDNKKIGGNNLRTSDLFQTEVGFSETGTETKQTIGFTDETNFGTLERTRTTNKGKHTQAKRSKERQIRTKQNNNLTKEKILNTRIVNLSAIELTQSETNLLRGA